VTTVVLDTDAASRLHRGREHVDADMARRLAGKSIAFSFVTVGELYLWAEIRSWGERRRGELEAWLDSIPVLPSDNLVASKWGRLTAAARRRGRPRPVNDTWIAACCLANEVPLFTYNRADFEDFWRYDGLTLVDD
jgi:predicted nucleic acid-binding protein